MQAKKILLFVCNDCLLAYGWRRGQLNALGRFPSSADGRIAFAALVKEHAHLPHYVLLDVVEEDFHTETVPHVLGKDRAALLRRKLQQQFRGGHYVNAWVQGREDTGRRDDRVLLSGLLNNDLLDGWLDILDHRHVPLAMVCSMALLSVSIVKRFQADSEHVLLVTEDQESGIRQSYFRQGELKFSRLTAMSGIDEGELAPKIMAESRRTRQYLASLRLVTRDDQLTTLVLCHADKREQLQRECRSSDGLEFLFLALEDVARAFRIKTIGSISVAELMLHLIGQHSWRNHYAPASRRRNFWLWISGRMLTGAAVFTLLAGIGGAGWLLDQGAEIDNNAQTLASKIHQAERLKRASVLPASDLPGPAVLKQAVERVTAVRQNWPSMSQRLAQLGGLFDRYPQLSLDALSWGVSPTEELLGDAPGKEAAGATPPADAAAVASPENGQAPPPELKRYEIVRLQGKINPFTDNYRFAIDSVEQFGRDWEQLGKVPVRRLKMPLYTKSDKELDVDNKDQANEQGKVDYELLLLRPLLPEVK